jgi:radical SAM superfamily enzyme YgiQ (UPF0313 family)
VADDQATKTANDSRTGMARRRVLIVCTHLRRDRSKRRTRDLLQPLAGLHVASMIDHGRYDVALHHEDWHGPFDTARESHYDIVFLSGLHADFDRMRQLSYHFKRRGALVVAGGSFCSLFPEFASRFFDTVCTGGIESVAEVMADFERGRVRGIYRSPQTRSADHRVDYRLLRRSGIDLPVHLVESSRGCSFRCKFCVIPAEGARHAPYKVDAVEAAIDDAIAASPWYSIGRLYPALWFIDNNFSDSRERLLDMCARLQCNRKVRAWGALVTQNILKDRELVRHMAAHKCRALFAGVESLDTSFLRRQNKKQNLSNCDSVVGDILYAESLGICLTYAYLFDPRISTTDDMRRQIRNLVDSPALPMPAFFSMLIPLAGTEDFNESARRRELRPNLRLRELDGETIAYANLADTDERMTEFMRTLSMCPAKLVSRWRMIWSTVCRIHNAGRLNPFHWYIICASNFRFFRFAREYQSAAPRSYLAGNDPLDPQYLEFPADISEHDRALYFDPVKITDARGELAQWLSERSTRSRARDEAIADMRAVEFE